MTSITCSAALQFGRDRLTATCTEPFLLVVAPTPDQISEATIGIMVLFSLAVGFRVMVRILNSSHKR